MSIVAVRRIKKYTVSFHNLTILECGYRFQVWEDSSLMGNHSVIGSGSDFGDAKSTKWVGEVTSRRTPSSLPVGSDARFAFYRSREKRKHKLALLAAKRAFPEYNVHLSSFGEIVV